MADNIALSIDITRAGMTDRLDELSNLISERLGDDGNYPDGKEGDDNALILWAYLEIVRLRGMIEAVAGVGAYSVGKIASDAIQVASDG
jgi:hypothetical protein